MGFLSAYKTLRGWQKLAIWAGFLFVVYTVFGFFIFPRILQSVTTDKLTQLLGRETTIEKITFNPYSLYLTLDGLTIKEKQSDDRFFSIDQALVNLQTASILKLGPVIREVTIDGLFLNAIRQEDQTYNFSDLIPQVPAEKTVPENEETPPEKTPLRFSVSNIVLTNSTLMFDDRPNQKTHSFTELALAIPFISNLDVHTDIFVRPHFSVSFNGSPIRIEGQSKPFIASRTTRMELDLKGIDLPVYYAYLPVETRMKLTNGTLDLSCSFEFSQSEEPGVLPGLFLSADLEVAGLTVTDLDNDPILKIEALNVALDRSEVLKGKINIRELIVSSPLVDLRLDDSNRLNIYGLIPETPSENKADRPEASLPESDGKSLPVHLSCSLIELKNSQVKLTDSSGTKDLFSLQRFRMEGIGLETDHQALTVKNVMVGDGSLNVYRLPDQRFNLETLAPPTSTSPVDEGTHAPWQTSVETIIIEKFSVLAADLVAKQKGQVSLDEITLNSSGFSTLPGTRSKSTLDFTVNQKGRMDISGQWGINPLHADISLATDQIHLAWSQAFIEKYLNLIISGGILSSSGKIAVEKPDEKPLKASYAGDINISDFLMVDSRNTDELIKFKQLGVKDINFNAEPLSVRMDTLKLTEPVSNIVVDSGGSLNFSKIAKATGTTDETTENSPEKAVAGASVPVKIGRVILENGQAVFTDNSITPQFKTRLTQIHTTVTGLSSEETIQSDLDVKAMINNHTPITIKGKINPLKSDFFCDMTVTCSGMDLGFLSPYSGKYAGYNIQKGKLSLDLEYLVDQRKLESKNDLFLDQFDFGEKVNSEDAIKAPVTLAVALMKDPSGRIALNLPVKGSLDDPEFSVAGIVIKMIMNLMVKAATAPFSLLGSMFGGGEDLNIIVFEAGMATITSQAGEKVDTLIKALSQRPGLNLEIAGYVNMEKDRAALLDMKFLQILKAEKLKDLVRQGYPGIPVDQVELSDAEYDIYLKSVFDQTEAGIKMAEQAAGEETQVVDRTDQTGETADPEESAEDSGPAKINREQMIQIIRNDVQVTDDDLKHLSRERALAVKDAMLLDGTVDSKRVFTIEAGTLEPSGQEKTIDSGCVIMALQ